VTSVNTVLDGKDVVKLEKVLKRIGRDGNLPHWYVALKKDGTLPNMGGKTVGSVIEMLLVGVLETYTFSGMGAPLKLKIISQAYLTKTEVADKNLCRIALMHRDWMVKEDEARAKRVFRFLAYVNQADWRARRLVKLVESIKREKEISPIIEKAKKEFAKSNATRLKKDKPLIPDEDLSALSDCSKRG
jgi:hypothetical protein